MIDPVTGLPAAEERADGGVLGVRVQYRIFFDAVLADYDHAREYSRTGTRAPRHERDMFAAVVIGPGTPLQHQAVTEDRICRVGTACSVSVPADVDQQRQTTRTNEH